MTKFTNKFFMSVLVAFQVLNIYIVGFLPLGDCLLLLACTLLICTSNKPIRIYLPLIFFACYFMIDGIVKLLFMGNFGTSGVHNVVYFFILGVFAIAYFEYGTAYHILRIIAIFATAYVIFQQIAFFNFGFYPPGTVPFLEVAREDLTHFNEHFNSINYNISAFRPRSIFAEPADYGVCIGLFLCISLQAKKHNDLQLNSTYKELIIATIGVWISGSSTAMVLALYAWISYKIDRRSVKHFITGLLVVIVCCIMLAASGLFDNAIEHALSSGWNNRLSGLLYPFEDISGIEFLLGRGMDSEYNGPYLNGYARMFYNFGITGMVVWFSILMHMYRQASSIGKSVFWLYLLLNLSGNVAYGNGAILFIPFIIANENSNVENLRIVYQKKCNLEDDCSQLDSQISRW